MIYSQIVYFFGKKSSFFKLIIEIKSYSFFCEINRNNCKLTSLVEREIACL